jgi:hypothetical protein
VTLIAALKRDGSTFVLGDARQTLSDGRVTNPGRKVHILRTSLAVAWAGHRNAAEVVIQHLRSRLPPAPTWENIRYFLTLFPIRLPANSDVVVVGAFRDEAHDLAFKWESNSPGQLPIGDVLCEGSGADAIRLLVEGPGEVETDTGVRAPGVEVLSALGHLAALDFRGEITRDRGYGFGYEVVTFGTNGMVFVPRLRYLSVRAAFDARGKIAAAPSFGKGFLCTDSNADRVVIERWNPLANSVDRALLVDIDKPPTREPLDATKALLYAKEPLWIEEHNFTVAAVLFSGPALIGVQPGAFVQVMGAGHAVKVTKRDDAYLVGVNGPRLEHLYASLVRAVQ